jgi:hypothetical protein
VPILLTLACCAACFLAGLFHAQPNQRHPRFEQVRSGRRRDSLPTNDLAEARIVLAALRQDIADLPQAVFSPHR